MTDDKRPDRPDPEAGEGPLVHEGASPSEPHDSNEKADERAVVEEPEEE